MTKPDQIGIFTFITMFDLILSAALSLGLLGYLLFALLKPERF